jgi:hypothetical protein
MSRGVCGSWDCSGSGVGDVGEVEGGGGGTASMMALAHDGATRLQTNLSRAKKRRYSECRVESGGGAESNAGLIGIRGDRHIRRGAEGMLEDDGAGLWAGMTRKRLGRRQKSGDVGVGRSR